MGGDELRKKISDIVGKNINPNDLSSITLDPNINVEFQTTEDLVLEYVFSIITENYEKTSDIKKELDLRECVVDIDSFSSTDNLIISFTPKEKNKVILNINFFKL